jgi:5S rRNA maturation endonuclease (ribonuclease M5)
LSTHLKEKHHLKEKQEKILQVIEALVEESSKGALIVVEGKKDVEALRAIGVQGQIFCLKTGGKSFTETLRKIEEKDVSEVVLLLDFDRRGREGTSYLKQELERLRIKPNLVFWRALSSLVGREVQCVESLCSYLETLQRKTC